MADKFLFEELDTFSKFGGLKKTKIPNYLTDNLNSKFELRPYQKDAFARFFHCLDEDFPGKESPLHFLFNMATGSGKTLIMAGLILYLYEKGYRNFLFFVNSTNIIEKTKDNFLNPASIKYLFHREIQIDNHRVTISPVDHFEGVNENDINICFTTIQKLHSDLNTEKENAITFEDFRKRRIVLIADEAHHMNVTTRSQQVLFGSWEDTVEQIFEQNEDNILLEFTATHDYKTTAMVEKYRNKVIIRYDLLQFRNDGFSKDVVIVHSDFDLKKRILQALLLSQYKQEVAAKYQINLKPVILFKAQRTIDQSKENKANFHRLVDELSTEDVAHIRKSNIPLVQRAFKFFNDNYISDAQLVERVKWEFQEDYCLSVNEEKEKENHQILVNTLEARDNRIRAVFAVQKLNEGWDVLNLFDIVRCYEGRDSGKNLIGKTTISEAQLIGRGARYFPFVLHASDDRFRRKFDGDLQNEMRVIEELHYHSINNSHYISEIRAALVKEGVIDEREVTRELKLKDLFKQSEFYNTGVIWCNNRRAKNYQGIRSFKDLGVTLKNHAHTIATGHGEATAVLESKEKVVVKDENRHDMKIRDIGRNVVQNALARNPFFNFASLKHYFPNLTSVREFISSDDYLGGLEITFRGNVYRLREEPGDIFSAMTGLLNQIESEIRLQITEYEGTNDFQRKWVKVIFKDKLLKFEANNPHAVDDKQFKHFVSEKDWFAFNTIYGTSEEKSFVRMLDRQIQQLQEEYDEIYLIRNEKHFTIYNFSDGQAFQPDFVLFLRKKSGKLSIYQLFIEPKGKHLKEHDRWKEKFLKEISTEFNCKLLTLGEKKFRLIGMPFYNSENENKFIDDLNKKLTE